MRKAKHGGFVYWRLIDGELLQLLAGFGLGLKHVVESGKRLIEQGIPGRQIGRSAVVRAPIDGRLVEQGPGGREDCRIEPLKANIVVDIAEGKLVQVHVTEI